MVLGQRWLIIAGFLVTAAGMVLLLAIGPERRRTGGLVAAGDTVARQPSTHAGGEIPAIMGIEAACV